MTEDWLLGLYRKTDLATLAARILSSLDERGWLPYWGWSRDVDCSGFTRSGRESAMRVLVRAGYVDERLAFVGMKGKRVLVRSARYGDEVVARNSELAAYRHMFPWWMPSGPLQIPGRSGTPDRAVRFAATVDRSHTERQPGKPRELTRGAEKEEGDKNGEMSIQTRKAVSPSVEIEDLKPAVRGVAEYPGYQHHKPEKEAAVEELAHLMRTSREEAEMYAAELAEGYRKAMRRSISPTQAAQAYLTHKNWVFKTWRLEG